MTRLRQALNAIAVVAVLGVFAMMIGAFGLLFAEPVTTPLSSPHITPTEK